MNEQDQRYFDNKFSELKEEVTILKRTNAILLERTKPKITDY